MWCICPPETAQWVRENHPGHDVLVIQRWKPVIKQLLVLPQGADIMCHPPASWPEHEQIAFVDMVENAALNIETSRDNALANWVAWSENSFWNHDHALGDDPIDLIPKHPHREAIIIGGGPSKADFVQQSRDFVTYASWSAGVEADYICHCDHRANDRRVLWREGIIYTPTANFEFLRRAEPTLARPHRYVYFDRGNPVCWPFAEKRDHLEHEPISGHVVDMMLNVALYAEHPKIRLIGVDLSCPTEEACWAYHPTVKEVRPASNYNGEVVYTDDTFLIYAQGIEELIRHHPEIEFTNLSPKGLVIAGCPYEPIC